MALTSTPFEPCYPLKSCKRFDCAALGLNDRMNDNGNAPLIRSRHMAL